jgi:hypothetical protein
MATWDERQAELALDVELEEQHHPFAAFAGWPPLPSGQDWATSARIAQLPIGPNQLDYVCDHLAPP